MNDGRGPQWRAVADEGLRLSLRITLMTALIVFVFPRLPGVRSSGSAVMALMVAGVFAVLGRLGHSPVEVSSVNPQTGAVVSKSRTMHALTARRWGWVVVLIVWTVAFLVVPSLLLRLFALIPATGMEFEGWWSTLLPAVLFLLVHALAVSTASAPPVRGLPHRPVERAEP